MPYIAPEKRIPFDRALEGIEIRHVGELAYCQAVLTQRFLRDGYDFAKLAAVFGTIVLLALEVWTRIIRPYEFQKCQKNGDVFVG